LNKKNFQYIIVDKFSVYLLEGVFGTFTGGHPKPQRGEVTPDHNYVKKYTAWRAGEKQLNHSKMLNIKRGDLKLVCERLDGL
jgi:hypothetical protein